jgi:hypothetical protein
MCIAIYKPADKIISKETLERCFRSNPDGAGFMFNHNRKLVIEKGFFDFNSFYEEYVQHETKQCVIHFRIKTHGVISSDNCHPFSVTPNLAFVHNGVIAGYGYGKLKSDTMEFSEEVLTPIVSKFGKHIIRHEPFKALVEERIGWSKLVFLDSSGNYEIYNSEKGYWDDGVWYSNTSYKPMIVYQGNHSGYLPDDKTKKKTTQTGNVLYPVPIPSQYQETGSDTKDWYIKRPDGKHIYKKDYVTIKFGYRGYKEDEIFEVVHISDKAICMLNPVDNAGSTIYNVPSQVLEFFSASQDIIKQDNDIGDNWNGLDA